MSHPEARCELLSSLPSEVLLEAVMAVEMPVVLAPRSPLLLADRLGHCWAAVLDVRLVPCCGQTLSWLGRVARR